MPGATLGVPANKIFNRAEGVNVASKDGTIPALVKWASMACMPTSPALSDCAREKGTRARETKRVRSKSMARECSGERKGTKLLFSGASLSFLHFHFQHKQI